MFKKSLKLSAMILTLAFAANANAALISTPTQSAFNDVNNDNVLTSADYLNPNFDYTLSVDKFDERLGSLVSVNISLNGFMEGTLRFENKSQNATSRVRGSVSSFLELFTIGGISLVNVLPEFETGSISLGVFDGANDFSGTSGATVETAPNPITATESVTLTDSSLLSLFVGAGQIDLNVFALSGGGTNNFGGDIDTSNSVRSAASIDINYVYDNTPVNVNTPATLALFGLSLAFAGFRARSKKS